MGDYPTTAPAAQAKLLEIVGPVIAPAPFTWAAPTEEKDYDLVNGNAWMGDVSQDEDWITLGGMAREETYTVELWAQVYRRGDDPKATADHAWLLRNAIAAAVGNNFTLDDAVDIQTSLVATTMTNRPATDGWLARAQMRLRCTARLH